MPVPVSVTDCKELLVSVIDCRDWKGTCKPWLGREGRFKAGTFENEKQKKCCSWGNSLSPGMLPRSCYSFLAKATGKMKSGVHKQSRSMAGNRASWKSAVCKAGVSGVRARQARRLHCSRGSGLWHRPESAGREVRLHGHMPPRMGFSGGPWVLWPTFWGNGAALRVYIRRKIGTQETRTQKTAHRHNTDVQRPRENRINDSSHKCSGNNSSRELLDKTYDFASQLQPLGNAEGIWEPRMSPSKS